MGMVEVMCKIQALEQQITAVYSHLPFGHHTLAPDGTFLEVNALELSWLGAPLNQLIGKQKFTDFLTPASQEAFIRQFTATRTPGVIRDLALELVNSRGAVRPISLSSQGIRNGTGQLVKHRGVCFDMTQDRQNELKLRIAAIAFESLSCMFVTDSDGVILQVNQAFTVLTGYSAEEVLGQKPSLLSSGQHGRAFYDDMWASLKRDGLWQGEIINRRKDGGLYMEWLAISSVKAPDGGTTHYVANFIDISANKAAEAAIHRLAYFDPLTLLANRQLLKDRMTQALATTRLGGMGGAVLMIDLDHFKLVNDTIGHEVGDLLLVETAARLQKLAHEGDCVARLGGDEFVVMLVALDTRLKEATVQATHRGEAVLAALREPYQIRGQEFHCTASMGIDMFGPSVGASDLLKHADLAMYQAKKSGRNGLRFFDLAMQAAITERVALEHALRQALVLHQFRLHYQPQVNLAQKIVGSEVLLRWSHPERGLVPPMEFIPLAEETGQILAIGQWVLESACAQLKAWEHHPLTRELQLAVNVSACQFDQDDFVAQVRHAVVGSAIRPELLKLELTESMVVNVTGTIAKMQAIKALGVTFSMDDFGTGYSSLSSLTQLPLSQLKIDQSFVRNMGVNASDAVIVQTIIGMAHTLGMEVIAEGVETDAQKDFLARNGCQMFQGYLLGRPVAIDAFEALLA